MWRSAVQVCLGLHIARLVQCARVASLPWDYTSPERERFVRLSFNRGGLAQLARAPALQAGGQRFESVILHTIEADGAMG